MFFRKDYAVPGPGVDPNAPEKTGIARFVEILQLECVTLVKLNLLFLASCLPVVTLPPALFALHAVIRRMVLDQPVDCFHHYRTAFRTYWRRAYGAFFLTALPLVCAGFGAGFYLRYAAENPLFFLPFLLCSTVLLVVMLSTPYLYGILTLDRPLGEAVRLALMLGIAKPLRAVLAALCSYGLLLAAVLGFPLSALYLLLIGFSAPCLLAQFYLRTVIRQYVSAPDT